MASLAKKQRLEMILIRLCDKFIRTEVNIICPMIKAENSVRVLYKLEKESFDNILLSAGEENGLNLRQIHWNPSLGSKMNESTLFVEYTAFQKTDQNDCRKRLRETLELKLQNKLKGKYILIDEVDDIAQTVPQPIISEFDFELHKLKLFCKELPEEILQKWPDLCTVVETIELVLEELNDSYTTFAVLSQNGKGKSFILNLLLLMTADSQEEYINNNKNMQLPQSYPDHMPWETFLQLDFSKCPDVVKDFIVDKKSTTPPVCYQLTYNKETEASVKSFLNIGKYFSKRRMLDLEPYVLPQKQVAGAYESTTKCIVHLRYGTCYQMKVEYFKAEELQQQLYELFTNDTDFSQVNSDIMEKAEKCLRARYKDLTGHEFNQEEPVNYYKDIKLLKEVLAFAGKTELYIGKGENSTCDRLALWDVLKALTTVQEEDKAEETKRKIAAVKEILVYVPSKLLWGGREVLEMPGTDDSDPIAMFSIRNALTEADAVILVTEYGFKICEKEVKDMLSDSGFLKNFANDPLSNKLMLVAYPEKNFQYQFSLEGKEKIKNMEQEARRKKDAELKTIAKMLEGISIAHENSIFTTYLLPVLHSSILSQKDPQPEHEVIAKHSGFLKYTGIMDLFSQLDEYVLSKQKASFDQAKRSFENLQRMMHPEMTTETAKQILQKLGSKEFKSQLIKLNREFEENLKTFKGILLDNVDEWVEQMLKEYIPYAKEQWNANKDKVTSIAVYNPNFIGKNPKFKVRLFHIFFKGFEDKKKTLINNVLQLINNHFEIYKKHVIVFYHKKLNAFLEPMKLTVSLTFVEQAINDNLTDAKTRYIGNVKRPFNKKALEKLMDESQRASLKSVILENNYRKCSLEEAKKSTEDNIEECIMKVKDNFMKKLYNLHDHRFKSVSTLLWSQKGGSKVWRELELKIKRTSRDRNEDNLQQVIKKLKTLMEASFNG